MTSVLGLSMPKIGISKQDITSPKNIALGGIAATSVIGGGVIGALVLIGAYFIGRSFGRTKLAPSISPGKTVEGLYGGMAGAAILGGGWVWLTGLSPTLLALAPLFALAAQGGDLFESGMKRRAGVKDSGDWLPGHGGLLDRLDGLVPVAVLTAAAQLAGLV